MPRTDNVPLAQNRREFMRAGGVARAGQADGDGRRLVDQDHVVVAAAAQRPEQGTRQRKRDIVEDEPQAAPAPANCSEAVSGAVWAAALTLCQTEAEGGSSAAALALAGMHEKGQGVAVDLTAAAQWYRGAAEGGSTEAAYGSWPCAGRDRRARDSPVGEPRSPSSR